MVMGRVVMGRAVMGRVVMGRAVKGRAAMGRAGTGQARMGRVGTGRAKLGRFGTGHSRLGRLQKKLQRTLLLLTGLRFFQNANKPLFMFTKCKQTQKSKNGQYILTP